MMISRLTRFPVVFLALGVAAGCSHAPPQTAAEGPMESPWAEREPGADKKGWVTLIGLNDLHGAIRERMVTINNGVTRAQVRVGGVSTMGAYFNLARAANPQTLVLDAGDIYQGSYLSNTFSGQPVVRAYNALKVDATTFGNHEFDYGQDALKEIVKTAQYPYLSANVVSEGAKELLGFPEKIAKSKVFCFPDRDDCAHAYLKIGVVGASTESTPEQTVKANVTGLKFLPFGPSVAEEAQRLRDKERVNLVVLVTHEGGGCKMTVAPRKGNEACKSNPADPITDMLGRMRKGDLHDKFPLGYVDAVIAGHTHKPQGHLIHGVPVLQNFDKGKSFGKVDFMLDLSQPANAPREKRILDLRVSAPVYFCRDHLQNYPSCAPGAHESAYPAGGGYAGYPRGAGGEAVELGSVVPATWLKRPVKPVTELEEALEPEYGKVKSLLAEKIADLPAPLKNDRFNEAPMGNCVADAWIESARAAGMEVDFAITHSGGIRESFPEPVVTFDDVYEVIPFEGKLVVAHLNADQIHKFGLGTLGKIAKNIAVVSSQLKVKLSKTDAFPRFRGFLHADGKPLDPSKTYRVLTAGYNAGPGIADEVFKGAQVEEVPGTDRDHFIRGLKLAPASCRGGKLDRTVLVD
jgi:5'-nucleotidase